MGGKKLLSLIIIMAVSTIIYSCGSSDSNNIDTSEVALHEHAFKDTTNLYAQFSHVTVVDFEHAQEPDVHEKDSETPGVDVIPFRVKEAKNHNFQFEDMGNGNHYAILRNEDGEEVTRIDANGTSVTVWLEPGDYKLYLHNMGAETFTLFLQPLTVDVGSNRQASYNWFEYHWFKIWKSCSHCDLSHANLSYTTWKQLGGKGANLSHANLSYASLEESQLDNANLKHANLKHASLYRANLDEADLPYADMEGANLEQVSGYFTNMTGAHLLGARFYQANLAAPNMSDAIADWVDMSLANMTSAHLVNASLTYARLYNTDLTGADLSNADLYAADLSGARLDGAIWVDGHRCQWDSIGQCLF